MINITVATTRILTADTHALGNQGDIGFQKFTVVIPKIYLTVDMTAYKAQLEYVLPSGRADSLDLGTPTVIDITLSYANIAAPSNMYLEKGYVNVQISTYLEDGTKFFSSSIDKQFKVEPSLDVTNQIAAQNPALITALQNEIDAEELARANADALLVPKTTTVNGHALTGNVTVSKADLVIENVDNTSDVNKPISTAGQAALDLKVDKVTGKGLSENDFTTTIKNKVDAITGTNTGDETETSIKTKLGITTLTGSNTGDQDLSGLVPKGNAQTVTESYTILETDGVILVNNTELITLTMPTPIGHTDKEIFIMKISNNTNGFTVTRSVGTINNVVNINGAFTKRYDYLVLKSSGANWYISSTSNTDRISEGDTNLFFTEERVLSTEGTVDDTLATPASIGYISQLLSWLAGRIKGITGKASWLTAPAITLETLAGYFTSGIMKIANLPVNIANGIAGLDADSKILPAQLLDNVVAVYPVVNMPYIPTPTSDSNITITSTAHGLLNGMMLEISDGTGAMPSGLSALKINNAKYPLVHGKTFVYVINKTDDTFQVTALYNGSTAITLTSAGTAGWTVRKAGDTSLSLSGLDFNANGGDWELVIIGMLGEKSPNSSPIFTFNDIADASTYFSSALNATWGFSAYYISTSPIAAKKYADFIQTIRIKRVNSTTVSLLSFSNGINTDDFSTIVQSNPVPCQGKAVNASFSNLTKITTSYDSGDIVLNGTTMILRRVSNNANGL